MWHARSKVCVRFRFGRCTGPAPCPGFKHEPIPSLLNTQAHVLNMFSDTEVLIIPNIEWIPSKLFVGARQSYQHFRIVGKWYSLKMGSRKKPWSPFQIPLHNGRCMSAQVMLDRRVLQMELEKLYYDHGLEQDAAITRGQNRSPHSNTSKPTENSSEIPSSMAVSVWSVVS